MGHAEELAAKLRAGGIPALDELIDARVSESLSLDFKRSSDGGAGRGLSSEDRANLAKAISGFGNSQGGILIWGVRCSSRDEIPQKSPLEDPQGFVAKLQSATRMGVEPPHQGVEHFHVLEGNGQGYAISLIPQSDTAPHQCAEDRQYYLRSGSSFGPVPHSVLAGMFGKRPQPRVFLMYATQAPAKGTDMQGRVAQLTGSIGFRIRNEGRGIARDLYFNLEVLSHPREPSQLAVQLHDPANWMAYQSDGWKWGFICKPDFRLPPRNWVQPAFCSFVLKPPFDQRIRMSLESGCEGAPPFITEWISEPEALQQGFDELAAMPDLSQARPRWAQMLGIPSARLEPR